MKNDVLSPGPTAVALCASPALLAPCSESVFCVLCDRTFQHHQFDLHIDIHRSKYFDRRASLDLFSAGPSLEADQSTKLAVHPLSVAALPRPNSLRVPLSADGDSKENQTGSPPPAHAAAEFQIRELVSKGTQDGLEAPLSTAFATTETADSQSRRIERGNGDALAQMRRSHWTQSGLASGSEFEMTPLSGEPLAPARQLSASCIEPFRTAPPHFHDHPNQLVCLTHWPGNDPNQPHRPAQLEKPGFRPTFEPLTAVSRATEADLFPPLLRQPTKKQAQWSTFPPAAVGPVDETQLPLRPKSRDVGNELVSAHKQVPGALLALSQPHPSLAANQQEDTFPFLLTALDKGHPPHTPLKVLGMPMDNLRAALPGGMVLPELHTGMVLPELHSGMVLPELHAHQLSRQHWPVTCHPSSINRWVPAIELGPLHFYSRLPVPQHFGLTPLDSSPAPPSNLVAPASHSAGIGGPQLDDHWSTPTTRPASPTSTDHPCPRTLLGDQTNPGSLISETSPPPGAQNKLQASCNTVEEFIRLRAKLSSPEPSDQSLQHGSRTNSLASNRLEQLSPRTQVLSFRNIADMPEMRLDLSTRPRAHSAQSQEMAQKEIENDLTTSMLEDIKRNVLRPNKKPTLFYDRERSTCSNLRNRLHGSTKDSEAETSSIKSQPF